MATKWTWVGRYVLVIVITILIGGVIGELALFKQAHFGTAKLTAADAVRFLCYGGALALLWFLGQRASTQLKDSNGKAAFVSLLLLPCITLIVLIAAFEVVLIVLAPFLSPSLRNVYNWLFVLGISLTVLWLVVALFHHSEPLIELLRGSLPNKAAAELGVKCKSCGATAAANAKFCPSCGAGVSA